MSAEVFEKNGRLFVREENGVEAEMSLADAMKSHGAALERAISNGTMSARIQKAVIAVGRTHASNAMERARPAQPPSEIRSFDWRDRDRR
jgi:hypothetical protein